MRPSEPRDGEIFLPDEKVRVFLFPHAFGSQREAFDVPAGLSVTEAIKLAKGRAPIFPVKFGFYLQDGTRVPEEMWDHVRLKPNTSVVARPVAEAPVVALIGALSTAFAGFQAAIAALGIFGKLIMLGISIGLQFLLNKLFAPKPPTPSDAKPVYSISASRNQVAQWQAIPLLLGRMRLTPPLAAAPYTETVGDDQYLRQLFCNGYGPLALEEWTAKIGETLVSSYPEAEIQHRYGNYVGEPITTLYPASVIDQPLSIELKKVDPPSKQTCATDGYQVALDFMFPNGLCWISEKGQRNRMGYSASIYYRELPSGSFVRLPDLWVVLATQKATRRTLTFNLPNVGKQYEFQVHKEGQELSQAQLDRSKIGIFDTCMWTAIRTFRTGEPVRFTDAPISLTALRVRASGRINQSVDTYNIIATSKVTSWNGSAWVAGTASRWPPDLFRWVLQCGANRRPFPDSKIDLVALQNWSAYCKLKGFVYDKWIIGQMSVFDLLTEICAAGRAMPVFKDGKWSVVWDDQNVPISQLFTPRNSWNFEEQRDLEPIPHGYRIRFPNEVKEWKEDEFVVYNDGYWKGNATLLEGFDTPGQTHGDRVWRHGRYHLAQRILRPGIYSILTSWDALPLIRGDRVRVNFDSFKYGLYAGRVVSVTTTPVQSVTVDTNLTLSGTTGYIFRFRLASGAFLERSVDPTLYNGEYTTITLVGTGLPMPAANDLFSFGYAGSDSRVFRVTGIEPMEDMVHRLTLVADAPEIANADIGQIPDYKEGITDPIDPFTMPPKNFRVTDGVYSEGGVQYWAVLYLSWEGPPFGKTAQYQIQYREQGDDPDKWISLASQASTVSQTEIRSLEAGVYSVRIRCVFNDGSYSSWLYAPDHATTEFSQPPGDVTNFRISTMGDLSVLRWDEVPGVNVSYELRHAADGVIAPVWNGSIPLIDTMATSAQIGTRTGTFFIKAKRPWGLASLNAVSIYTNVASLTSLNFDTTITEGPTFAGTKTNTEMVDEELRLTDDVTGLTFQVDGTYNFFNQINLGENISARLTLFIDAYGFNPQNAMSKWVTLSSVNPLDPIDKSEWEVRPEYRVTQVNPTLNLWDAWRPFGGLTDTVAWGIQFRLVLKGKVEMDVGSTTIYSPTTPAVQQLSVTVDMADRIEKGEDLVSSATADTVVTYPGGRFRVIPALVITPQNMVQGDYWVVNTPKNDTNFTVNFYTSAGARKALKFDWMAKGWGRVQ